MPSTPWQTLALQKDHVRNAFSCGTPALDRYLHQQARQDHEKQVAAVFVLLQGTSPKVLAYYTLSAFTIETRQVPATLARKLPRYPQLPVTLLGRLAVDQQCKGQGIGQFMLLDALRRCHQAASDIAAMAVVVDAKDEAAAAFYLHYGFIPLDDSANRLFLPMATIAKLFN